MVQMSREELYRRCGYNRAIAALAALEGAGGKKRPARDGAHEVAVNNRMRCRSRQRMPRSAEKNYMLRYYRDRGEVIFSLVTDV